MLAIECPHVYCCDLTACLSAADLDKNKIIATATLLVELKFIRSCGKCGHIEDVVVDSTYRGLRLGKRCARRERSAATLACSVFLKMRQWE
jgi:GNAT superfamily N-acetyltransferase